MMNKAKWFAVKKLSIGEIFAKSANQIVPLKFCEGTGMLYCIHLTPLSSLRVEEVSGNETIFMFMCYQCITLSSSVV